MVPKLVKSKSLIDESSIFCFVPLSLAHGAPRAGNRYDAYSRLTDGVDGKDNKTNESALIKLHASDIGRLRTNDVDAWMAALRNWVQFLNLVIQFREPVLEAILAACDRFHELIADYNFGDASVHTQRALAEGCYHFSKQVVDALKVGQTAGAEAVPVELFKTPLMGPGSALCDLLNTVIMSNAMPPTSSPQAPPAIKRAAKPKPAAKSVVPKTHGTRGNKKAAGDKGPDSRVQQDNSASSEDDEKRVGFCGRYLSATGCNFGSECKYSHEVPQAPEDCEKMISHLKRRKSAPSKAFAKACGKAKVEV
jgi:hypothetical protein